MYATEGMMKRIMTDREKLEKAYEFAKQREDFFYKPIEDGRYELGSLAQFQCQFQAASFQQMRYFLEELMEENND